METGKCLLFKPKEGRLDSTQPLPEHLSAIDACVKEVSDAVKSFGLGIQYVTRDTDGTTLKNGCVVVDKQDLLTGELVEQLAGRVPSVVFEVIEFVDIESFNAEVAKFVNS